MSAPTLETVSGVVEQINAKRTGLKMAGEWLNISQYHPLAELPLRGHRVEVQVERTDRGAWINALEVLDGGRSTTYPDSSAEAAVGGRLLSSATFGASQF